MTLKIVTGSNTVIKKITVGTPVRKVTAGSFDIRSLGGIDLTNLGDGALLIYNETSEKFEANQNLDNQNTNLNGGNF